MDKEKQQALEEPDVKIILDQSRMVITASDEGSAVVDANGTIHHFWRRVEVPFRIVGECEEIPAELIIQKGVEISAIVQALLDHRQQELEAWSVEPPVEI